MEEEKHFIKVQIAGKIFKFNLRPEEEEMFRAAVKMVKELFENNKSKYKMSADIDALAVAAVHIGLELYKERKENPTKDIINRLKTLDNQLDEYIENGR
ncbi:MAG: cell division protein ZapA [Bacteroidales bacterium]